MATRKAHDPKHDPPWKRKQRQGRKARAAIEAREQRIAEAKARANYEADAPRCGNCSGFRKAGVRLENSIPIAVPSKCRTHDFPTTRYGCCDAWTGVDGDTLLT